MIIYRLARTEFCDVSGEGAKRYGGRWNLPGHPALYGCNSVSAALLERLTIDSELFAAERYVLYSVMEFTCPYELIYTPALFDLPDGWNAIPASHISMEYGTTLLKKGILCFQVPSVVDPTSFTLVLNPISRDFKKVKWKVYPLRLDQRMVR